MTYWNGTRWTPEPSPPRPKPSRLRRFFGAGAEALLITTLIFGLIAGTTLAAKGGNGGNPNRTVGSCSVDGNVVSATGLPTYEVLNFMVTDADGTRGWVLGITWEGWWNVTVADRSGPTTYEFAGRTYGPNGSRYTVYSSCSTDN